MRDRIEKFKLPIGLSLVGIVLIVGGMFSSGISKAKPKVFPKESLISEVKMVSVDVAGAVSKPGVYQVAEGSRIADAVSMAGGLAEGVNKEYVSKYLNMAQKLGDGTKLYIPFEGEEGSAAAGGVVMAGVAGTDNPKVNINTGTQTELEALSGIGPVTASKIISDRPYQAVEDLLTKKILSKTVFEKVKDSLSLY